MLSRIRHWSARYAWDRLNVWRYERLNPDAPWLTQQMIGILESWLKPTDVGVEWGSGRSTIWLARRVAHITTIEDNPEWAGRVADLIRAKSLEERVNLNLAPISAADRQDPASSIYIATGQKIAPNSLDFALIDGAFRDQCTLAALQRLKPGAILIVDNVERYVPRSNKSSAPSARGSSDGYETAEWEQVFHTIAAWRCVWTTNGVSDTAFWVKPTS